MSNHLELGKKGEEIATNFLVKKGYEILDTNWRYRRSEIDIIIKKAGGFFVCYPSQQNVQYNKPSLENNFIVISSSVRILAMIV